MQTNPLVVFPLVTPALLPLPTAEQTGSPTPFDQDLLIRTALLITTFGRSLEGKKTETTVTTYRKRLSYFLTWLKGLPSDPPLTWSIDLMLAYRKHLDHAFRSPRAKNGYLVVLRQLGIFIKQLYHREMDPAEFVKGWKAGRTPQRRHLPVADAKRFLEVLATDPRRTTLQRLRNHAMGYLMLKTGLRAIEVSRARLLDLQIGEPGLYWKLYVYGKGRDGREEWVKVLPEVYEKLDAYLQFRGITLSDDGPLFATTARFNGEGTMRANAGRPIGTRSIHRIMTEGLLLAGAKHPGIVVHSLRHSTATYALLNKANPVQVQRMMRHKHYATTEVYVSEVQQMIEGAEGAVTQI